MRARTESRVVCWTSAAENSTPVACARALTLSPSVRSSSRQSPSSAATSSLRAGCGQCGCCHDAPPRPPPTPPRAPPPGGALVLQALKERPPFGIDRSGVRLIAGIEILDVVGIAAVQERRAGESGVGVLPRHAQALFLP